MTTVTRQTGAARPTESHAVSSVRIRLGRVFRADSLNYFLVLGITVFLVALGLAMVLSSSAVESKLDDGSFFGVFLRQGVFAVVGLVAMLLASSMPERFWMRVAWPALFLACGLQLLVLFTDLGVKVGGNRNWLALGPVQFQPSELIKVAIVLWLGAIVTKKEQVLGSFGKGVLPILLVGGTAIGLVLAGEDLGTVMVMGVAFLGALFLIGVKLRHLFIPVAVAATVFLTFALSSENRMGRILSFWEGGCSDYDVSGCFQFAQGQFTLAGGGVFGVGLGNSEAKWMWLPEADNDFIFAIIGEEMGLVGALVVILLFVALAFALARSLHSAPSSFGRAATAFVLVWVIGQACVNIGVVLGVFPVLGVPLPLISSGGSALVTTLFAIGIVLSFTREHGSGRSRRRSRSAAGA